MPVSRGRGGAGLILILLIVMPPLHTHTHTHTHPGPLAILIVYSDYIILYLYVLISAEKGDCSTEGRANIFPAAGECVPVCVVVGGGGGLEPQPKGGRGHGGDPSEGRSLSGAWREPCQG